MDEAGVSKVALVRSTTELQMRGMAHINMRDVNLLWMARPDG